jgi:hypothetical protein
MRRIRLGKPWFQGWGSGSMPICWQGWLTVMAILAGTTSAMLLALVGVLGMRMYVVTLTFEVIVFAFTVVVKTEL